MLVEALGYKRIADPILYHCNFIARPENKGADDEQLFFAELKKSEYFIS